MSQLYRQMEEDVARKVRETMDLANSKRRALGHNKSKQNEPEGTVQRLQREPSALRRQELEHGDGSIDTKPQIVEIIEDLGSSKAAAAKRSFLAKDIHNIIADKKEESNTPQFHIGFEHIRDNVDKTQISNVGQTTELPAALDNRDLGLGALSLAQTAAKDIANQPYILDESDKRQLAEAALNMAQSAAWNIDNQIHEADQRHLAEGALNMAQSAARNLTSQAYRISDAEKRHLAEEALIMAQSAAWNIENKVQDEGARNMALAEETLSLARRDPPDGELNLALAEGALNLAKNVDNRLEFDNNDKRGFAEGALSLAQNAAWNINNKAYESEGNRRGIAEGALRLAQNAARDLDEVQTTNTNRRELAEGIAHHTANMGNRAKDMVSDSGLSREVEDFCCSFESTIGSEKKRNQKMQLGFDNLATFYDDIRNDTELAAVLDEINNKTLAEHDKKTFLAADAKIRQLSEDLQNLEMDIDNNNCDPIEVDESKKELAMGALNLAQTGAKYIGEEVREISGTMRELGEGALGMAQTAARQQYSKEGAKRSLDDTFLKKLTDEHKQTIQLGFEQIDNCSDSELQETKQAGNEVQRPPRLHGSRRRELRDNLDGARTNK